MKRSDEILVCPNHCDVSDVDTPFFYPESAYNPEAAAAGEGVTIGVLAYPDSTPSNRFEDGTAGVPGNIIAAINASDELPHCIKCLDEAEWEHVIAVVFRKWPKKDGDIIMALFPEIVADYSGHCSSYEHVGQHGGADYFGCIARTKPATPEEYADLKKELESYPYHYQLRPVRRASRKMLDRKINGGGTFK